MKTQPKTERDYQLSQLQTLAKKVYFRSHQELFEYVIANNKEDKVYQLMDVETFDDLYELLVQNIKLS